MIQYLFERTRQALWQKFEFFIRKKLCFYLKKKTFNLKKNDHNFQQVCYL